jgi:hypothetical protein
MGFFPARRTHPLTDIRSLTEDTAEQAVGRVQCAGNGANNKGLEASTIACSTAIAVKLELKSLVGALIGVIAGEFNFLAHEISPPTT